MPKKLGTNPKAQAAREKKQELKNQASAQKEKAREDALWQDDDKQLAKKQQRKDQKEKKRLEDLQKKQENKALLDAETTAIASSSKKAPAPKKITRAAIDSEKEKQAKAKAKEEQLTAQEAEADTSMVLEENPNQKMAELLEEQDGVEARNVDEAIAVLSLGGNSTDKHPEKRMKAAYADFESREMPLLKEEYSNLRLSQLKQMLRKKWQTSPDNPMNKL